MRFNALNPKMEKIVAHIYHRIFSVNRRHGVKIPLYFHRQKLCRYKMTIAPKKKKNDAPEPDDFAIFLHAKQLDVFHQQKQSEKVLRVKSAVLPKA